MNISEIKPYTKNAKKHPEKQIKDLMRAIERFGFNQPVVIDKNNEIVVGHCRVEAGIRLGFSEIRIGTPRAPKGEKFIPAIRLEDLTDDEIKAYRLADNKLNESPWIMSVVIEEMKELELKGFDVELTGFSLDLIRDASEDNFDIDKEVSESQNTKIKKGDLFQLGAHRLLCGDATNPNDYLDLMDNNIARMVFTDPPYNINYEGGTKSNRKKILNDKMSNSEFYNFLKSTIENLINYAKGAFYICMSSSELHNLHRAFVESGGHWQTYITWVKNHFTLSRSDYQHQTEPILHGLSQKEAEIAEENDQEKADALPILYGWTEHEWYGGRKQGNVWFFDKPNISKEHPTMKPIALCAKAIVNSSHEGEIVLDVFGGSGSTLIACEQMKRKCFMMELDPIYTQVIINRWEKFTGEKVEKIEKKGGVEK